MKVLILGVNGFIGHSLVNRILADTDWEIYGMDLDSHRLGASIDSRRFHFIEGDIGINREWIEYHVKKCDVILPLVAIATPKSYVERPLEVFRLDFEENLRVVRQAHQYGKWVVFPSTSEVYGMCPDPEFDEYTSPLVLGPISKSRWIYSCAKQMLDRVISAYGEQGLKYTLFRPFNWIGPKLDAIDVAKEGSSRVVTQFVSDLIFAEPIRLVDGGLQKRCFTYIDDGIDCLMTILKNPGKVFGRIYNIGHPGNECTIKDLAELLLALFKEHPDHTNDPSYSEIVTVASNKFYGDKYQDITTRKPSIEHAAMELGWKPGIPLREALKLTMDSFLAEWKETGGAG
ncbi:MAG: bifunctional UDP-4-keto-pentose/UDP-xylose synthase [Planctomycetes bacterium]|nr:bifunctional UDP-4-keto-pentose/UDP-xylose synthase [Planctomycetota bacterium]